MKEESKLEKLSSSLQNEGDLIVERLIKSFTDLETAIESARISLSKVEKVPQEVIARLDSYFAIIEKQRKLTDSLKNLVTSGNVQEVARHISLINGLSSMIIDDAKGILSGLNDQSDFDYQDETSFC